MNRDELIEALRQMPDNIPVRDSDEGWDILEIRESTMNMEDGSEEAYIAIEFDSED